MDSHMRSVCGASFLELEEGGSNCDFRSSGNEEHDLFTAGLVRCHLGS